MIHLISPTPDLQKSLDFYQKLGFNIHENASGFYGSDGDAVIHVCKDRFIRPGVGLNMDIPDGLKEQAIETALGSVVQDPSGIWIYFTVKEHVDRGSAGMLGNLAGISLECFHMKESVHFFEGLGFEVNAGNADQGWVSMGHPELGGLSCMAPNACPHMFYNPSYTYFNSGKNPEIIAKIRENGVPIEEEVTYFNPDGEVDNVILKDPGGVGFFVFND